MVLPPHFSQYDSSSLDSILHISYNTFSSWNSSLGSCEIWHQFSCPRFVVLFILILNKRCSRTKTVTLGLLNENSYSLGVLIWQRGEAWECKLQPPAGFPRATLGRVLNHLDVPLDCLLGVVLIVLIEVCGGTRWQQYSLAGILHCGGMEPSIRHPLLSAFWLRVWHEQLL